MRRGPVNGCLKGVLRLGCLALVLGAGLVAWWFREPLLRTASRWLGPRRTALPPVTDTAVGAPTPRSLASSQTKAERLKQPSGPDSVVLSPNEVAALIGSGLDWSVRKTFDSLRVELLEGSLAVHCRLDTRAIPPDALGPFGAMLNPMEPLRLAGPVTIERPGIARWRGGGLGLRGVPVPAPMIRPLGPRLAPAGPPRPLAPRGVPPL